MEKLVISVLTIICFSCTFEEPEYYYGSAKVEVIDGAESYSLLECGCWQTTDSISVYLSAGPFSGIGINISNKGGEIVSFLEYYSDTDEYDGEMVKSIPIFKQDIEVTYILSDTALAIKGKINIISKKVDNNVVEASGTFNCLIKENIYWGKVKPKRKL